VAACDARPERREALAAVVPDLAWHDSLESLLANERLDFVDICAPPTAHAPAVRQALERGLHVLCEKPLVLAPGELDELSALARSRNRALATVHNWRHAPQLARAGELLRSGAIGPARRCRWQVYRDRPSAAVAGSGTAENWRLDPALSGGGILTDHGWHALYVIPEWMGAPRMIRARLTAAGRPDAVAEDTAEVRIRFKSAEAEIFLTWRAAERRNRVEIEGETGALTIEGRTLELRRSGRPPQSTEFREALSEGSHHPDWFGGVAAGFLDEIRHPQRRGGTLAEAAVCLSVIRAARESSPGTEWTALWTEAEAARAGGSR
jgi:predicted dehydrogenase